jgi:CheY-like chemotaxis protein
MNLVLPGRTRPLHENFLPDSELAHIRLLIVEDDPFLQSYLSEILLECPLQVFIADSINEAVGFYLNKPPDILLMESYFSFAQVPSLDLAIEQRITTGSLHLITITDTKIDNRFSSAHPVAYLTKPLVPGELTRLVMSLAENQLLKKILG